MTNPFDELLNKEKTPEPEFELVEDSLLACQECGVIVTEGKYYDDDEILTWVCHRNHTSTLSIKL